MARWDRLYKEKVARAGITMHMYERYVDDSNQIATAPLPGSKYNEETETVVIDPDIDDSTVYKDAILARVLREIANSVMSCIKMEADWPSNNRDSKMPILDMKVWMDKESNVTYQHYEKDVASKTVLHSKSAHSASCKRSVHTQEVVRRLLNSSHRLDWKEETAPVITEYMERMKNAGYKEEYRKNVLQHALGIYDRMWMEHREGIRPIFRPKDWKKKERREIKKRKKHDWATKGGHIAPIFVPTTPDGILAKMMRKVAEEEAKGKLRFKIVESGGVTLKSQLQKSNPTGTPGCRDRECLGCKEERGKGGNCHKNNVNYMITCQLCGQVYVGETSRNLYTRGKEHMGGGRSEVENESCFVRKHMSEEHEGEEMNFSARVTHSNKDSLTRQIREGVMIRKYGPMVMNTKSEWFQPPLYRVRHHVVRE